MAQTQQVCYQAGALIIIRGEEGTVPQGDRGHRSVLPLFAHTPLGTGEADTRVGLDEGELLAIRADKLVVMRGRTRRIGDGFRGHTVGSDRIPPAVGYPRDLPIDTLRQLALHMTLPIIGFRPRNGDRKLLAVLHLEPLRGKNVGPFQCVQCTVWVLTPDLRGLSSGIEQPSHREEESEAHGLYVPQVHSAVPFSDSHTTVGRRWRERLQTSPRGSINLDVQ
jgi:hypothetical protein